MEKDRSGIAIIKMRAMQKVEKVLNALALQMRYQWPVYSAHPQALLLLFLCLIATPVAAHSRYSTVKIPVSCSTDRMERADSLVRTLPGVFSASWSSRHHLIVVVYDRTQISRQKLMKAFGNTRPQHGKKKDRREWRRAAY
mgnify:CR=1 FL=1